MQHRQQFWTDREILRQIFQFYNVLNNCFKKITFSNNNWDFQFSKIMAFNFSQILAKHFLQNF